MANNTNPCRRCNGVGLVRNDNPHSDRVYGHTCTSCNGTGIAGDQRLGFIMLWATVIVTTVVPIVAWWLW